MLTTHIRRLTFERLEDRRVLAILTVNTLLDENGTGPNLSLREAIDAANNGDIIQFSVTGQINLGASGGGHITINNSITIQGPGWNLLTVRAYDPDGSGTNDSDGRRALLIDNDSSSLLNVAISNLTFTNGDPVDADENTGGGAILNRENLTINYCVFDANFAPNGGAILNEAGTLTINDSTISNNAAADGGGVLIQGNSGALVVNRTWIINNTASNSGGGALTRSRSMTITDSTISGNSTAENGGGIYQYQALVTVNGATISNNTADSNHDDAGNGGGTYNAGGTLTIVNSTVSGNSAVAGGGIFNDTAQATAVKHSTITGNVVPNSSEGQGGGIRSPDTMTLEHTIVAGNLRGASTRDDVSGNYDATYSLIGDRRSASVSDEGGSLIGTTSLPINAMLAPLANNGGSTMTHLLLSGSPAIDAGNTDAGVVTFDQRGAPHARLLDYDGMGGAKIDMGAVELHSLAAPPTLQGDYNRDSGVNAGDFVLWRKTAGTNVTQAYAGADGDGNTIINQQDYAVWQSRFGNLPASASQTLIWTPAAESAGSSSGRSVELKEFELSAVAKDLAIELLLAPQPNGLATETAGISFEGVGSGSNDTPSEPLVDGGSDLTILWQGI